MVKKQSINKILKGKHSFFRAPGDYDRYRKKIIAGMDKEFNTGYAKLSAQYKKDTARVLKALKKRRKK